MILRSCAVSAKPIVYDVRIKRDAGNINMDAGSVIKIEQKSEGKERVYESKETICNTACGSNGVYIDAGNGICGNRN